MNNKEEIKHTPDEDFGLWWYKEGMGCESSLKKGFGIEELEEICEKAYEKGYNQSKVDAPKHTEGSWKISRWSGGIIAIGNIYAYAVENHGFFELSEEDAYLVSKAPDMYEELQCPKKQASDEMYDALKDCIDHMKVDYAFTELPDSIKNILDRGQQVLAKAEGGGE